MIELRAREGTLLWERLQGLLPFCENAVVLGDFNCEVDEPVHGHLRDSGFVNAMAAAGIVSLPGMMTGQILSGTAPVEAVKYQILIMFLIASGTGLGTLIAIIIGSRRLFDKRQRLRLDRLVTPKT